MLKLDRMFQPIHRWFSYMAGSATTEHCYLRSIISAGHVVSWQCTSVATAAVIPPSRTTQWRGSPTTSHGNAANWDCGDHWLLATAWVAPSLLSSRAATWT